jgi:hypothetical protein
MGLLSKIFGAPAVAAKGAAGAAVDVAKGASEIVERWVPSAASKNEVAQAIEQLAQEAAAHARLYDPRTEGKSTFSEIVNVVTDALSRLIRPVAAVAFMGALFGWWDMETRNLDPFIVTAATSVLTFYFGARAVYKDVPEFIKAVRDARRS